MSQGCEEALRRSVKKKRSPSWQTKTNNLYFKIFTWESRKDLFKDTKRCHAKVLQSCDYQNHLFEPDLFKVH